jgi:Uma2 family endonuclease
MILDRELIREIYATRTRHGNPPHDEVWAGTLVLYAPPDNEHQLVRGVLAVALRSLTSADVMAGANVAGDEDWLRDYRCPDVCVYLASNTAKDCDTHWVGGPDIAVEITSPGEDPRLKLDFHAKVKTRELLIVDRDPWAVELYQLRRGKLVSAGTSDAATSAVLASGVLPLKFQLRAGTPRPTILLTHTGTGQTWTA